jgi:hypothetical protein
VEKSITDKPGKGFYTHGHGATQRGYGADTVANSAAKRAVTGAL